MGLGYYPSEDREEVYSWRNVKVKGNAKLVKNKTGHVLTVFNNSTSEHPFKIYIDSIILDDEVTGWQYTVYSGDLSTYTDIANYPTSFDYAGKWYSTINNETYTYNVQSPAYTTITFEANKTYYIYLAVTQRDGNHSTALDAGRFFAYASEPSQSNMPILTTLTKIGTITFGATIDDVPTVTQSINTDIVLPPVPSSLGFRFLTKAVFNDVGTITSVKYKMLSGVVSTQNFEAIFNEIDWTDYVTGIYLTAHIRFDRSCNLDTNNTGILTSDTAYVTPQSTAGYTDWYFNIASVAQGLFEQKHVGNMLICLPILKNWSN